MFLASLLPSLSNQSTVHSTYFTGLVGLPLQNSGSCKSNMVLDLCGVLLANSVLPLFDIRGGDSVGGLCDDHYFIWEAEPQKELTNYLFILAAAELSHSPKL